MAPDPSSEPELDPNRAETLLRTLPELELLGLLRRSSNYTFLARLSAADQARPESELLAVYKPARGESPLWDFPDGTLYRREVAAYVLARSLGWPRIPPTVVRADAPHGIGALQLYIDADLERHYLTSAGQPPKTWMPIALFDVIVNNADRKSGHCLTGAGGRIWVIDHGLTFHPDPKLRTVIWDFAGRPLPSRLRPDLDRVSAALEGGMLEAALCDLLSPRELNMLRRRIAGVLSPGWHFPEPGTGWAIPWPPV